MTEATTTLTRAAVRAYVEPALLGRPIKADALGNTADPEFVANADNVFYSEKMRTLFIGEDSGAHQNNFVWAYDVATKKLTRILSLAAGAEATGLQVVRPVVVHPVATAVAVGLVVAAFHLVQSAVASVVPSPAAVVAYQGVGATP